MPETGPRPEEIFLPTESKNTESSESKEASNREADLAYIRSILVASDASPGNSEDEKRILAEKIGQYENMSAAELAEHADAFRLAGDIAKDKPPNDSGDAVASELPATDVPVERRKSKVIAKLGEVVQFGSKIKERLDMWRPKSSVPVPRAALGQQMLKKRDEVVEGWDDLDKLHMQIQAEYGVKCETGYLSEDVMVNHDGNLKACQLALDALVKINPDKASVESMKISILPSIVVYRNNLQDGVIRINPESDPGQVEARLRNLLTSKVDAEVVVEKPKARRSPDEGLVELQRDSTSDPEILAPTPEPVESRPVVELADSNLAELRQRYLEAKKALAKFGVLKSLRDKAVTRLDKMGAIDDEIIVSHKERVKEAFDLAQKEYDRSRAEYVGENIKRHIEEKKALNEAHFAEFGLADVSRNKVRIWVDRAANYNLCYAIREKMGKTGEIQNPVARLLAKPLTAKNLAIAGLTGGGYLLAAAATRGVVTGFAMWGGYEKLRARHNRNILDMKKLPEMDIEEVESHLAYFDAMIRYAGNKEEDIHNSEDYKKLLEREEQLLQEVVLSGGSEALFYRARNSEESYDESVSREKAGRQRAMLAGAMTGALVASGGLSKLFHLAFGTGSGAMQAARSVRDAMAEVGDPSEITAPSDPSIPNESGAEGSTAPENTDVIEPAADRAPAPAEAVESTTPPVAEGGLAEAERAAIGNAESSFDQASSKVTKAVGSVEQTVFNLKNTDPERFEAVVRQLNIEYPGKKLGQAIHLKMEDEAELNGFTIGDGGPQDLDRITSSEILTDKHGHLKLGKGEFMEPKAAVEQSTTSHPSAERPSVVADDSTAESAQTTKTDSTKTESVPEDSVQILRRASTPAEMNADGSPEVEVEGPEAETVPIELQNMPAEQAVEVIKSTTSPEVENLITSVDKYPKTIEALRRLLRWKYSDFMKDDLHLGTRQLNRIQTFSVTEFLDYYSHKQLSDKQLSEYKGLADALVEVHKNVSGGEWKVIRAGSLRDILVRLAAEKLKK